MKRKSEWVDNKTKKQWIERYSIVYNPEYDWTVHSHDIPMEDRKSPWLVNNVKCDFCFGPEWELLFYHVKTSTPKTKLDIWTHDFVENLYTKNPSIRKEMVICRDCELKIPCEETIIERENRLQICFLDLTIKFE